MKTLVKLTASALLLALSVSVSLADDGPNTKPLKKAFNAVMYPAAGASKVWMMLEKTHPEFKVNVALVDKQGNILFQETLPGKGSKRNNGYSQLFDLSEVKDGDYTFRVSTTGFQTEEFKFRLTTPTVTEQPTRVLSLK